MARMEPNRLVQDELQYELAVRGISECGTVETMRKALRELLRLEKLGKTFPSIASRLNIGDELDVCETKLEEIKAGVENYDGTTNVYKKLETKLWHVMGRLERLEPKDSDNEKKKSELFTMALTLSGDLEQERTQALDQGHLPVDPMLVSNLTQNPPGIHASTPVHSQTAEGANPASDDGHQSISAGPTIVSSHQLIHK